MTNWKRLMISLVVAVFVTLIGALLLLLDAGLAFPLLPGFYLARSINKRLESNIPVSLLFNLVCYTFMIFGVWWMAAKIKHGNFHEGWKRLMISIVIAIPVTLIGALLYIPFLPGVIMAAFISRELRFNIPAVLLFNLIFYSSIIFGIWWVFARIRRSDAHQ